MVSETDINHWNQINLHSLLSKAAFQENFVLLTEKENQIPIL